MRPKTRTVLPSIGTAFEHRYKGKLYRMVVVKAVSGIAYNVEGVGVFQSPTAAAKAVVGEQFINGWKFWKIDAAMQMASSDGKVD